MHVLVIPSWYPTTEAPGDGIYFAEQMDAVAARTPVRYGVVFPEMQSLRRLSWAALRRKRFQVIERQEGARPVVRRLSWNVFWRLPLRLPVRVGDAVRLARRYAARYGAPDLVHAQSAQWAGAAAVRVARRFGVPCVVTEHLSGVLRHALPAYHRPYVARAYAEADALAAVSPALRAAMAAYGADPEAVHVVPNMVDTAFFTRPPTPRSAGAFRLVTVARLDSLKRLDALLRAFARAFGPAGADAARLDVVGDGPMRDRLVRQAHALGIAAQVTFRGRQGRAGVRQALWDAHALVLPSRYETFGVVLVEAMATGLPCLATRCGGPEAVLSPATGRLLDPHRHDEDAFVRALAHELTALREGFVDYDAGAIRAHAVARFGADAFARRTLFLYREALRRHASRPARLR